MDDTVITDVHVEVLVQNNCLMNREEIEKRCYSALLRCQNLEPDVEINQFDDPELQASVKSIILSQLKPSGNKFIHIKDAHLIYHIYQIQSDSSTVFDLDVDRQEVDGATYWCLPSLEFIGLWESLIFDSDIKYELLKYVFSTLLFSERQVNFSIIPWNKIILLHGPPGTGKTSLCKAFAQKICIYMEKKFTHGNLLEINCHSLFSKWFSESGKLVAKMFHRIDEVIADPESFLILLVDEVESLAHSRKAAFAGNAEPSDAIRVVNSLLNQLDRIKRYPNVLILTTSNITEAIDIAVIDRADIKRFVGLPSSEAIYQIYHSCICELQRVGIIFTKEKLLTLCELKNSTIGDSHPSEQSLRLRQISLKSVSLSGRTIRKLPLLAHSNHAMTDFLTMDSFLDALEKTIDNQFQENVKFSEMCCMFKKM